MHVPFCCNSCHSVAVYASKPSYYDLKGWWGGGGGDFRKVSPPPSMNPPPFDKALLKRGSGPTQAGRGALWGPQKKLSSLYKHTQFSLLKNRPDLRHVQIHMGWGGGGGGVLFPSFIGEHTWSSMGWTRSGWEMAEGIFGGHNYSRHTHFLSIVPPSPLLTGSVGCSDLR